MIHAQAQATDARKKFHEIHLLPKSKANTIKTPIYTITNKRDSDPKSP
jgi:hypothetical protein